MKIKRVYILLFLILLLGSFLRFYKISSVPVSLYWDEVASTYNGYSIAETGKDEYGTPHPLMFKSFIDYKTPANIYLTGISVKLFGLNEFSTRFSSAFLGSASILVVFLLISQLLYKDKFLQRLKVKEENFALLTTLLFSISPWHIGFSRTGFEANVGLFFVLLGMLLFLIFLNLKQFKYYFLSMFIFAVSIYFYRSIFIFVPLILSVLFLLNFRFLLSTFKKTLVGVVIFMIILTPFIPVMLSKEGMTRQRQVSLPNNSFERVYKSAKLQNEHGNTTLAKIAFNRRIVYVQQAVEGYVSHFIPNFWLYWGDGNLRHTVFRMGMIYKWEFPFLLLGLVALFKLNKDKRNLILAWIILAPIPASLSVPAPHALRTLNMLPMPQILIALGLILTFVTLKGNYRKIFVGFVSVLAAFSFFLYLYFYYGESARLSAKDWADGYKQLTSYVIPKEKDYDKLIISGHYWQPYIYFLFYKNYPPEVFQKTGSKHGFDNYFFGGTKWDKGVELGKEDLKKIAGGGSALVALSPEEYLPQRKNIEVLERIYNHNNELVFIIGRLK